MISAVVFDYFGVIDMPNRDLMKVIRDYLGVSKEEWNKEYFALCHLFNIENKNFDDCVIAVAEKFGMDDTKRAFIKNIFLNHDREMSLNTDLLEMIKELKEKNYKIGLMSNYSADLRQILIDKNIFHFFDVVVVSGEVGYQKPDPRIFEIMFNKLEVKSHEVIFIDDTPNSLEGAEDIGYTPILFKNNTELREVLFSLV